MARKKQKSPYRKGYLKKLEVMRILRGSGNFQVVLGLLLRILHLILSLSLNRRVYSYRLRLEDSTSRRS